MGFDPTKAAKLYQRAVGLAREMVDLRKEAEQLMDQGESLADMAEGYVLIQNMAEVLTDQTKEWNKMKEGISYTKIPEAFMEEGVRTITTQSGFRVGISSRLSVGFQDAELDAKWLREHGFEELSKRNEPVTAKQAGYEWLRDNGHGALIQETVNSSSLSAAVKRMIEEDNIEPPTELFNVKPTAYTSVTKVKK